MGTKWFARALALVGGGVIATVAIVMAYEELNLTCKDVDKIVETLKVEESPDLIPFQQVIAPLVGCETVIIPKCSKRPDGTYCRNGREYGPGIGGVRLSAGKQMGAPVVATCDVVDAEAKNVVVPCETDGHYDPKDYDTAKVDPVELLERLAKQFPDLENKMASEAVDIAEDRP